MPLPRPITKSNLLIVILWVILGPLQNRLRITGIDHLALPVILYLILENDLKFNVFLAAVESAVAS